MKKIVLTLIVSAVMLSITSCEDDENIRTFTGQFVYLKESYISDLCSPYEIKARLYRDSLPNASHCPIVAITGDIPSEYCVTDTIVVKIVVEELCPKAASMGGFEDCSVPSVCKIKSIERI